MATPDVLRGNCLDQKQFEWTSLTSLKYSDDFRKVIYKNNPYDISCDYKRIFETYAREQLVSMSSDVLDIESQIQDIQKSFNANASNCNTTIVKKCCTQDKVPLRQRCGNDFPVIRSSKAVGTSGTGSEIPSRDLKDFGQWIVCDRIHTVDRNGCRRHSFDATREVQRRSERTICAPASPQENHRTKIVKANNGLMKSNSCIPVKTSRDVDDSAGVSDRVVISYSAPSTPVKIKPRGSNFRHHKGTSTYIQEYRQEYTYRNRPERNVSKSFDALYRHATCACGQHTYYPEACYTRVAPRQLQSHTVHMPVVPLVLPSPTATKAFPMDRQMFFKKWEEKHRKADQIKRS
ncbi:hypothetical protein ACJMK2_019800 [Sinanodonta woodiana]|uniref:Uncharacterized protein n=1 Tax=Sinanodonta woodiana TaxID=1069815 RepID=A0ABD3TYD9_SINWO